MTRSFLSLIAAGSLLSSSAADLPVREVVLYKNGVGYFERGGALRSGESARLDFRADEMNDVLKSLTVRDASGATMAGLRYDSADPLDRKLAEYPFRLSPGQPLSALLDQVKGTRVEVQTGSSTVIGAVAGSRVLKGADNADWEQIVVLTDDGQLRTIDMAGVNGIKFADPQLQQQLKDYLGTLTASRSKDKKSIYFDSANDRARNLSVSYMVPTPVWKSSYRLLFDAAGAATLEGWAIVDNTTGEDWTNVKLALVSGRPVSFVSQLYPPRYVARATVQDDDMIAAAPRRYEAGVAGGIAGRLEARNKAMAQAAPPPPAKPAPEAVAMDMALSTLGSAADTREIGELFEYRFGSAVTVKKNESAMLPFLQQKLGARKLLIWTSGLNPMNAAELTNSTGKTLDGGPITVFDGGSYAGEALMDLVKQGDKRLIGFSVDQGARVENRIDSGEETVQDVKLMRGVLTVRTAQRQTTTYNIKNIDAKEKKLIIEHPLRPDTKVIGTQPVETTTAARRFEITLRPKADEKLAIVEEAIISMTEMVSNLTPDALLVYQRSKNLSDAARRGLEQIAEAKRALAQTDADIQAADKQLADMTQDQTRLRENIRSLNNVAGQQELVQRYAKQLSDQETQIVTVRDRQSALRGQRQKQQNALDALIEKLSF